MLSHEEFKIIKNLKEDDWIVLMKPDKENGIVILDKAVYQKKSRVYPRWQSKVLTNERWPGENKELKRQNNVLSFVRGLKKSGALTKKQYQDLSPTGSRPGILCGLSKIRKPNISIRPILSAIGAHSYKLAKFLVPLLRPHSLRSYLINDSFFHSRIIFLKSQ